MKKTLLIFGLIISTLASAQSISEYKKNTQFNVQVIDALKSGKSFDKAKSLFVSEKDFNKIVAFVKKKNPNDPKLNETDKLKADLKELDGKLRKRWKLLIDAFSKLNQDNLKISEVESEFEIEKPGFLTVESEINFDDDKVRVEIEFDAIYLNGKYLIAKINKPHVGTSHNIDYEKTESTEQYEESEE